MNELPFVKGIVNLTTASPDYDQPCQVYMVISGVNTNQITDGPGGPLVFAGGSSSQSVFPFNPVPLKFNVGPHLAAGSGVSIYVGP